MLIEDGNGESEVAAAFLLLEETEELLSKVFEFFKEHNAAWKSIRVIMTDKDITERHVLSCSFYKNSQRIFMAHQEQGPSPVLVVTVPPPPKRP